MYIVTVFKLNDLSLMKEEVETFICVGTYVSSYFKTPLRFLSILNVNG